MTTVVRAQRKPLVIKVRRTLEPGTAHSVAWVWRICSVELASDLKVLVVEDPVSSNSSHWASIMAIFPRQWTIV